MMLSIIIPVYNTEKYVEKCIMSCVKQSCTDIDYEIIVVNDGSTDGSESIVKSLQLQYPNILLIDQENHGLSIARNVGLKHASGDYIWFLDSDDWLDENALFEFKKTTINEPDVIAINYAVYSDNDNCIVNKFSKKQLFCTDGISLLKEGYEIQAQLYIYNHLFLNKHNLIFYPGIYHEDMEFTPRMLFYAETIMFVNKPLYYVYKHPNSITTTINPKRAYDYIQVADNLISFIDIHKSDIDYCFCGIISRAVCNAMRIAGECNDMELKKFVSFFTVEKQKRLSGYFFKSANWKCYVIGVTLIMMPQISVQLYNKFFKRNVSY